MSDWQLNETYQTWELIDGDVLAWIEKRAGHCDRGHYVANVTGIESIDSQDGFPRYYMSLERAKDEMREWLAWRLRRERGKCRVHGCHCR
jgi:hypothetical protein